MWEEYVRRIFDREVRPALEKTRDSFLMRGQPIIVDYDVLARQAIDEIDYLVRVSEDDVPMIARWIEDIIRGR